MNYENNKILKADINKKESNIYKILEEFHEGIFALFYLILKNPLDNFCWECISITIQYSQFLILIIDDTFLSIWYEQNIVKEIQSILYYFNFIFFLKGKFSYYLAILHLYLIFLIFIFILVIVMSIRLKASKYNILWPLHLLKYSLPIISFTFFGHSFLLFISAFICREGKQFFNDKLSCGNSMFNYYIIVLSIISMIILLIVSYITISMYYKADFIYGGNNLLKKRTSKPDIIFFLCKILMIIIFVFDKEKEYEHWGILFFLCFITGFNVYGILFLQNFENKVIKRLYYIYSLFLFWGFLSLFISNIFKSWKFGGGLYLFIIGFIIIFIYYIFYSKTYMEFLHFNFNNMNTSQECINYIKSYLKIISEKEISRDSSSILALFIVKCEEGCTNNNCALKKYLISLSKGFDSNFLLLQYAQKLFKIALNKFPGEINLRIHYIIFLTTKINQKKNAQKELISIKPTYLFIGDRFNLYRCKKYLEEYNSLIHYNQEEGFENNDIFQALEYKNNLKIFKNLLSKSSALYYDFWSSLYSSHLQGIEDFKKLNDIGAELNQLIENIEKIIQTLFEYKNNDLIIIKLYKSFVKNILNDKEKYKKYNDLEIKLIQDNKIDNREIDYTNFDLKILNESDEYQFLIISANDENKGTIIDISLNACSIFGYYKQEIIGKNMNIFIPEIYHKIHSKIYNDMCEKTKTEFFENLSKNIIYTPTYTEISSFGRNKTKYLIPLDLKIFFVQTEENELIYVVDFVRNKSLNIDLYEDNENDKNQICCVLTDINFIIQTFTSNSVDILGLNSNIINSNQDITLFIKQFSDELKNINKIINKDSSGHLINKKESNENSLDININNKDKSFETKLKLKKKLIKIKYSNPRKITWKLRNNDNEQKFEYPSEIGRTQITSIFSSHIYNYKKTTNNKKNFLIEVKEAYISKNHVGYFFYFKKLKKINHINFDNLEKRKDINKGRLSPTKKPLFKRSSLNLIQIEESAKSSRIYRKEGYNSILSKGSFSKVKKKYLNVNFDLDIKKNLKYESVKCLSILDKMNIIDEKYIPKSNFNFYLDLETLSYKPSTKKESCKELYNILKYQSLLKLNILQEGKKDAKFNSSFYSSNFEKSSIDYKSSSYTSISNSNSSNNQNSSISNKNRLTKRNNQRRESIIQKSLFSTNNANKNNIIHKNSSIKKREDNDNDIEYQYYKVNINKIKFMIYDFNQEMVINNNNIDKKSQMEIIIENYKSKQNINISEDINYSNISFEKYINNSKNAKKGEKKISKEIILNNNLLDKEKEFEKEISYALSKKDEQKSITNFYRISFVFLIIIFSICISDIYFIFFQYGNLKENIKLIIYAVNLKYYTNYGLYYIRENILYTINNNITNDIYNVPDNNIEKYKDKISSISKTIFIECNSILESIIGSYYVFCKNTTYILKEIPFDIQIINGNSKIRNVTTNFYTSMIQVYSSFCNLLIEFDYTSIDNPNLYDFIHNSFNNLGKGLNTQIELFIYELSIREKNIIIYIIILSCINLFLHIILYSIICTSYNSNVTRKANYISVFYSIGIPLIKSSIKKCELFINKINQNDEEIKTKDIDDETSNIYYSSNKNINDLFKDNNYDKKSKKINNNNNNHNHNKKPKKNRELGNDKKSKNFKIMIRIFLIISFIYLTLVLSSFFLISTYFILNSLYIYNMQNYHNNIIELFNGYREFLFDEDTIISGLPVYGYLIEKEKIFYSSNTQNLNYLSTNNKLLKELYEHYLELQQKGYCNSYISYFNSSKECENYMGGKESIINLGFFILINSFVEKIRNGRNYLKLLLDNNILVGNLSKIIDISSNNTYFNLDKNESLIFRMKVFNMEEIHYRLNIIFLNIILQYIEQERNISVNVIYKSIENSHSIIVILISVYLGIFILIFVFYWIPMIRKLKVEIYKTKNMLTIIPIKILASQPNIKEILDISIKNN